MSGQGRPICWVTGKLTWRGEKKLATRRRASWVCPTARAQLSSEAHEPDLIEQAGAKGFRHLERWVTARVNDLSAYVQMPCLI